MSTTTVPTKHETSACPWWCTCSSDTDRLEGYAYPHARTTGTLDASQGGPEETTDVAVLLWKEYLSLGSDVNGTPVWGREKVAIDVTDGDDDVPAVVLSAARARSLAAALVYAADLIERGPEVKS